MLGKRVTQAANTTSFLLPLRPVFRIPRTNSNKPKKAAIYIWQWNCFGADPFSLENNWPLSCRKTCEVAGRLHKWFIICCLTKQEADFSALTPSFLQCTVHTGFWVTLAFKRVRVHRRNTGMPSVSQSGNTACGLSSSVSDIRTNLQEVS